MDKKTFDDFVGRYCTLEKDKLNPQIQFWAWRRDPKRKFWDLSSGSSPIIQEIEKNKLVEKKPRTPEEREAQRRIKEEERKKKRQEQRRINQEQKKLKVMSFYRKKLQLRLSKDNRRPGHERAVENTQSSQRWPSSLHAAADTGLATATIIHYCKNRMYGWQYTV